MAHDAKYGTITAEHGDRTHGHGGTPLNESDEPVFVIRSQDASGPAAVRAYADAALRAGASQEHADAVLVAADAMVTWQEDHPERVKVPD